MKKTKCGFRKISVLCFVAFFAIVVVFSSVTFSRFYSKMASENGAQVANAVAHYRRERLLLVSDGVETPIIIENNSKQIEIGDIQPEDEIKFYFSVSDTDGNLHNEVYLRVTIAFSVRLEMIGEGKRKRIGFSAGEDYSSSSTDQRGADLKFQRDVGTGTFIDVAYEESLKETDYSGKYLHIEEKQFRLPTMRKDMTPMSIRRDFTFRLIREKFRKKITVYLSNYPVRQILWRPMRGLACILILI